HDHDARDDEAEHFGRAPAERVRAHDAPDNAEQADNRDDDTWNVELVGRALRLTEMDPRERDRDEADRDVQPEDPLPRDPGRERAADDRADRDREARDPSPWARDRAALLCRGGLREGRQRE